jgi:hypothetical protein
VVDEGGEDGGQGCKVKVSVIAVGKSGNFPHKITTSELH